MAAAVSHCAVRPAPHSRAISAVTTTVAAASSVATTRSPTGVEPSSAVATRARIGVIGGWST